MKAVSIWQPWASLVAHGLKRYETRSWSTRYRGVVAIHAGKQWENRQVRFSYTEPYRSALATRGILLPVHRPKGREVEFLPLGAIVGVGMLKSCKLIEAPFVFDMTDDEEAFGDWTPGRYAWEIDDVVAIEPIPFVGKQGLFDLDDATATAIQDQCDARRFRQPSP